MSIFKKQFAITSLIFFSLSIIFFCGTSDTNDKAKNHNHASGGNPNAQEQKDPNQDSEFIIKVLPKNEKFKGKETLQGGYSSDVLKIKTDKKTYVLRHPKKLTKKNRFNQILKTSTNANNLGIGPKVINKNIPTQDILIEYLESVDWPKYSENSEPYLLSARMLKKFHNKMPKTSHPSNKHDYFPFNQIFPVHKKLDKKLLPKQFKEAIKNVNQMSVFLHGWLKKNAVLCHGDCWKSNIILTKKSNSYKTTFIDFDDSTLGHPIYDLAKLIPTFMIMPPPNPIGLGFYPKDLLKEYFGREPNEEELLHLDLMYLNILAIIATANFEKVQNSSEPKLTISQMESLFTTKDALKPFYTYPFDSKDPKVIQTQACAAIKEFITGYEKIKNKLT